MKKTLVMAFTVFVMLSATSCKSSKTYVDGSALFPKVTTTETVAETTTEVVKDIQEGDRVEELTVTDPSDASLLKDYNVVVGAFSSQVNAESLKNVMEARRYNAFLAKNPQGLLRVIAGSYDTRAEAIAARDKIRLLYSADDPGTCPSAWILIKK